MKPVENNQYHRERQPANAMKRGFFSRCPHCGQGRLFDTFIKVARECSDCKEQFHHHRADDLPAYIVIVIIGHIVLATFMATDRIFQLENWQHLLIWIPITVLLSLALLQPVKGVIVGLQWALRMHGFAQQVEDDDHPRP